MKNAFKAVAIVIAVLGALVLWRLVSTGIIDTPEVPISELNFNTQQL